jgi:hypothetical protein
MRKASGSDFNVDVDGLGRFAFARRTIADTFRIRGEYNRLTSGNVDAEGNMQDYGALAYVTLTVLLVAAPEGFDLDADTLEDDSHENKLTKAFFALREKELSFRKGTALASEEEGKGTSQ